MRAKTVAGSARLKLVRDLLTIRRQEIAPHLAEAAFGSARLEGDVLIADWILGDELDAATRRQSFR